MPEPLTSLPIDAGPHRPVLGILLRIGAMLALSVMFALVKLASESGVHLSESLFYRQAAAIPVMLALMWWSDGGFSGIRTQRIGVHLLRAATGLTAMALNFWSVTLLPLAEANTISFMVPIFGTILAVFFLSERIGWRRWMAVLLGFVGVLIVIQPGGVSTIDPFGASIALLGAAITAATSLAIRMLGRTEKSTTSILWFSMFSLPIYGGFALAYGGGHDGEEWLSLAGIGVFGVLAQLGITQSLRLGPVSTILPMDYTSLLWASTLGIMIFGQWPNSSIAIGAPIIIGSGLFIAWRERQRTAGN